MRKRTVFHESLLEKAYHLPLQDIFSLLETSQEGLTEEEAQLRLQKFGKNKIQAKKRTSPFLIFLKQFDSFLIALLIIAGFISLFVGMDMNKLELKIDGLVIFFIVFLNALLGFFQHWKAENILASLQSFLVQKAKVIRDNEVKEVLAEDLVPGDIILLEEGDKVPADARLIEVHDFTVDESLLTGESMPVEKEVKQFTHDIVLADRKNMIYMNTFVLRGTAKAVVVATGMETEMGLILATMNKEKEEKTNFEREFDETSKVISLVALLLIALVVFALKIVHHSPWLEVFLMAISLAVGAIPEALPTVVTFGFSLGSRKMSQKNFLVKQLPIIEEIGAVDVICTDKTGTLTENHMAVKEIFVNHHRYDVSEKISKQVRFETDLFFSSLALCHTVKKSEGKYLGDPTEVALVEFVEKLGITNLSQKYPLVHLFPFSSEKKYMATVHLLKHGYIAFVKGAPERLLSFAKKERVDGKEYVLTKEKKQHLLHVAWELEQQGYRVLGIGYHHLSSVPKTLPKEHFVFLGFVALRDPPRKGVKQAIAQTQSAGITVKMITGDNAVTAQAIAKEVGMGTKAISWEELKSLDEPAFKRAVKQYDIFARVDPIDKYRIVSALQQQGYRVAITGDGVNDVAAIKRADVGIAMGKRGADIAKEAADAIILDDNFATIVDGILEGRTIFHNVRKVVNYLLTANFAEVIMVFLSSWFGYLPILPLQLLWVNLVTDIFPALALAVDPPAKTIMQEKPKGKEEKILNPRINWMITTIGLKKALLAFFLFLFVYHWKGIVLAQTVTFTWLVLSHFVRIVAIRFEEGISLFSNKWLNYSLAAPFLVQLLILYTPLQEIFHVKPLSFLLWIVLVAVVFLAIWLALLITKLIMQWTPKQDVLLTAH